MNFRRGLSLSPCVCVGRAPKVLRYEHSTSPVNLLTCYNLAGFPPYDGHLRLWLERSKNEHLSERQRLREFIVSLLTVTKERLVRIEHELSGELSCNCYRRNAHWSAADSSIPRNELDENLIKRQERLASAFRDHMRDGQKFNSTGQYRREFFEEVIDRVNDVSFRSCL